ncbi:MAG TPA: hypothetical protein V6C97_22100 [Oculatellaceae cyanobacterium]
MSDFEREISLRGLIRWRWVFRNPRDALGLAAEEIWVRQNPRQQQTESTTNTCCGDILAVVVPDEGDQQYDEHESPQATNAHAALFVSAHSAYTSTSMQDNLTDNVNLACPICA